MTDELKKLAEAEAALGQVIDQRDSYHEWADRLAYAIGGSEIGEHSSINNPWQNAIEMAEDLRTRAEAAEAALSAMTAERDEARKQVNGLRLSQSLDKDSAYVIRELLNRHNVPAATFVDDHVANAIAQRDAAEAALSAAREDVARLKRALEPFAALGDVVLAEAPPNATRFDAFHGCQGVTHKLELDDFRRARATLTKEPHHG